jgi:hypothetical protein
MFEDRRARGDRRKYHNPGAIPASGCRRAGERRDFFRQYEPMPWWLQTNYAEELQPPLLDGEQPGARRPAAQSWTPPRRQHR